MGNRFNHHLPHRNTTNGIFLPMLCSRSYSTKDSHVITNWPRHHPKDLPSSPRVSCMGQVKNNLRNNKVGGFQTPPYKLTAASSSAKSTLINVKYHKLKRLFSGKNLFAPPATTASGSARGTRVTAGHAQNYRFVPTYVPVDITTLDPPLPVLRKAEQTREEGSLWKRRSCGAGLTTLQLEKIHVPRNDNYVQPTTV